ncbi:DsbA family oxidoreductase [Reinekea marina]|uniref:DsbA family oxidoreductase n=1 Tax=Reinekea marina TaxID=1310421 RepID=A0ABV7WP61_9GAMM|nr:DsbA family oxidoreductase [Reinekea marina]MDN3647663.1 DsbA family oxidoreductase [Reinekea marina]
MKNLKIDIVSDVMCPWCVVGYNNLDAALNELNDSIQANIEWHAFELNPAMPKEGQDLREHLMEKYGITEAQSDQNRQNIIDRGKESGFEFNFSEKMRMINSFDCHRLLTWAKRFDKQTPLKLALFDAHFTTNLDLSDPVQLLTVVESVGLDKDAAENVLNSDEFAQDVREEQNKMQQLGITSVPTFIVNDKYAISGGQPVAAFKQALTQISAEM